MPGRSASTAGSGGMVGNLVLLGGLLAARSLLGWVRGHTRSAPPRVDQRMVELGHETHEVTIGWTVLGGVLILVLIGLVVGVATWFQTAQVARPLTLSPAPGLATPAVPPLPPEPRLEETPGDQLRRVRAAEDQILTTSAWVDRQAGVARIPIDRAMDLTVQHGLPARSTSEAPPAAASPTPSVANSGRGAVSSTP